jgi:hypothetical protein
MNAEFNWWLLIVGLVLGAALTWLVMADLTRRDEDIDAAERAGEARWIATILTDSGHPIAPDRVEEVLRLHGDYLTAPPPDDPSAQPGDDDGGLSRATTASSPQTVAPSRNQTSLPREPGAQSVPRLGPRDLSDVEGDRPQAEATDRDAAQSG